MKIIECVPNFSEGKNQLTFDAMKDSIRNINGVKLLNFEPDGDYNRVVVTMAGNPEGILQGALEMSFVAAERIDMTKHKGEHPRLGAIDVVPFVPIKNTNMEECSTIANEYGRILSEKLNIPVYLYEESAKSPNRKNLADIRKGEYEGLQHKLTLPEWKPDYGDGSFNPKLGGTVTGARFFLIAYNVNIASKDVSYSKEIAEVLRESGRNKKDASGNIVKIDGKPVKEPGRLRYVKGMGVSLEKYGITQVSMNLTNYVVTPLHVAFEEAKKEAQRLGVEVKGSEIVGLVPLEALLSAGHFYANGKYQDEKSLVELAIESLGLSELSPFVPEEKIIDYLLR